MKSLSIPLLSLLYFLIYILKLLEEFTNIKHKTPNSYLSENNKRSQIISCQLFAWILMWVLNIFLKV